MGAAMNARQQINEIGTENDSEHGTRGLVSTGDDQPQRQGGGEQGATKRRESKTTETGPGDLMLGRVLSG